MMKELCFLFCKALERVCMFESYFFGKKWKVKDICVPLLLMHGLFFRCKKCPCTIFVRLICCVYAVYCHERENLCGLVGEQFDRGSGKDEIQRIIDRYTASEEVNGTGDEWRMSPLFSYSHSVNSMTNWCVVLTTASTVTLQKNNFGTWRMCEGHGRISALFFVKCFYNAVVIVLATPFDLITCVISFGSSVHLLLFVWPCAFNISPPSLCVSLIFLVVSTCFHCFHNCFQQICRKPMMDLCVCCGHKLCGCRKFVLFIVCVSLRLWWLIS